MIKATLKAAGLWLQNLLLPRQSKAEAWQQWRDAVKAVHTQPEPAKPKRSHKRKAKPSPPLNTNKLKQVRSLFNSEFVSRETNRHNQKAWAKALRILHESGANMQTARRTAY